MAHDSGALDRPAAADIDASQYRIPTATYRLQFHKGFDFFDAAALTPYLARLGISHVYASPYLKARPGSTHGYDIIDHRQVNPELGGEAGFRAMVSALREHGIGQILDFVRPGWTIQSREPERRPPNPK